MTPAELLVAARRLVERDDPRVGGAWNRAAALLARQALEAGMRERLIRAGLRGEPTFEAQLLALRAVVEPGLAPRVHWTWVALSRACHPGEDGPPTADELLGWCDVVGELTAENTANKPPSIDASWDGSIR